MMEQDDSLFINFLGDMPPLPLPQHKYRDLTNHKAYSAVRTNRSIHLQSSHWRPAVLEILLILTRGVLPIPSSTSPMIPVSFFLYNKFLKRTSGFL